MTDLKPCPLCGGSATLTASGLFDIRYSVQCDTCHSQSGASTNSDKVIALWNTRPETTKEQPSQTCPTCGKFNNQYCSDSFHLSEQPVSIDDAFAKGWNEREAWGSMLNEPKEQPMSGCRDEGCPHYGKAIKCEPKDGGCEATLLQQPDQFDDVDVLEGAYAAAYDQAEFYKKKYYALKLQLKREISIGWQPIASAPDGWIIVKREDGLYSGQRIVCKCDERDKGYGLNFLDEELIALEINPTQWMPLTKPTGIEDQP